MPRHLHVVLLAALLLLAVATHAASPFVSGAAQYNVVFPHYRLHSLTESGWLHDYGCWGSQFTAGVTSPDASVYLGYQRVVSSMYIEAYSWRRNGEHRYAELNNSWREARLLLGVQWHLNGRGEHPVKPTVGAALTYGESTLTWKESQGMIPGVADVLQNRARKAMNFGQLVEFGLLYRPRGPVEAALMAQCQRLEADFPDDDNSGTANHYVVLMPGWQLTLRYRFPSLNP